MSVVIDRPDVLIVLHDLRGGGAERAMLRLASGMASAGIVVELLLIQSHGDYLSEVPPIVALRSLDAASVGRAMLPLARYIRARRPRSILAALSHVNVVVIMSAALARFKGRVVVSERNHISSKSNAAVRWRDRLTYALVPYLYPLASSVAAVSAGVAADLTARMNLASDKVTYVHNPVFDATLQKRAELAPPHPWLAEAERPVILAIGRLHPQKDFSTLIAAFEQVRLRLDARLIIFGEGDERAALQRQIDASAFADDMALPGFTSEPLSAMARASVLALSSRWEGFPNVLVEALACGLPIVATDCPSGPDEILDSGRFGALVPMGDPTAMSEALYRAMKEPTCTAILRKRAETFSVRAAVARYAELLDIAVPI